MGHALFVEDDGDASMMLASLVVREGHTVACAATLRDARRLLLMQPPDLLLLDL
ncbi:MAG: two component, sigma54 specific, transcriptional regulator, Fis family, partial [Variovorax sp.]|nr:two component, sigma54 specific, transcriptional regulator, Fis family [Variovorax sp.]